MSTCVFLHTFTYITLHIYCIKIILRTWNDRWQGENICKSFISGEKLVPRKYKKQHNNKKNNPNFNKGNIWKENTTKIYEWSLSTWRYSTLFVTRKIQTKTLIGITSSEWL